MKILRIITTIVISFGMFPANAQTEVQQGYTKGKLVLADGSIVSGYVKDNIRRDASVSFINETDKKKKDFEGTELNGVEMNNTRYICIQGDFFTVMTDGELSFLQKMSDASGKVVYNGLENTVSNGTEGKPGDYFIYNSSTHQLRKIFKKNINELAVNVFTGCNAAQEKIKASNGDMTTIQNAVEIYNNRNKK